jgi:glycosyltransferase involved in cell wall biosynthesis
MLSSSPLLGYNTSVGIDILVLTKNNCAELDFTLSSIPAPPRGVRIRVVIIDGGCVSTSLSNTLDSLASKGMQSVYISSLDEQVFGIYPSMNLALESVSSDWFIFLNSGDSFSSIFSFSLIERYLGDSSISLVFGQARIESHNSVISWLVPDQRIRRIDRWLRLFEPNHQALFARRHIADKYKFDTCSPVGADASWKRNILRAETYVYVKSHFVNFRLGGVSTSYSFRLLVTKLAEPSRRQPEKLMEIVKFILFKLGVMHPVLQKAKSSFLGLIF